MYLQSFHFRSLSAFVILLSSLLLVVSGCSHRTVRGTSHAQTMKHTQASVADSDALASLDELAQGDLRPALAALDEDEDGRGENFSNDGIFSEEPLEDLSAIKVLSPEEVAKQYWNQRRQEELMSHQSGLKDIYFELDSWKLTMQAKQSLALNAEYLKLNRTNAVTIEGHCDERGTRAYNYVLGKKRALRVRDYLARLGVSPSQLTIVSYGKDNPLCRGNSEGCFQQNRRAHFLLGVKVSDARLWTDGDGEGEMIP